MFKKFSHTKMEKLLSKEEWLHSKLRDDFFILSENERPKFTGTSYDAVLFEAVNSAYVIKNRVNELFNILENLVVFDEKTNSYRIDASDAAEIKNTLSKDKILSGIKIFELAPKGSAHLNFLGELGAIIPQQVKSSSIPVSGANAIRLKNWGTHITEKYDLTFSNKLMDENSGIKYGSHSAVFSAFELYTVYSNITKKNGFSIHANGSAVSSLYDAYFQFIGFRVVDYFRNSDGGTNFTMIMKKINEKQVSYDEFFNVYSELKKRWPTRYGN